MAPADDDSRHQDSAESIKQGRPVQRASERLHREADEMERESAELRQEIEQARTDWARKRADSDVPGATPPEGEEGALDKRGSTTEGDEPEAQRGG